LAGNIIDSFSGKNLKLVFGIETRKIYLAQGIGVHESDMLSKGQDTAFQYLSNKIGDDFKVRSDSLAEYTNYKQRVHYIIRIIQSKDKFKNTLMTKGVHVVYLGHARFGRGACFDVYSKKENTKGDQWEQGMNNKNGLLRLGYPYIDIPFRDPEHHKYHFAPVPAENDVPPRSQCHPNIRRQLSPKTLPESLRELVYQNYRSEDNRYWGFTKSGKIHILIHAGWENTLSNPYDLGATNLKCKVFCHFGCNSRIHFWRIVRKSKYKGWVRSNPPIDKFAYFTTAPSTQLASFFWLYYVLKYPYKNNFESWWKSLEWAKGKTNIELRSEGFKYKIY